MNLLVVLLKSVHFKFLGFPKIQNVCQVSKLLGQHPEATKGSFTWESLKSTLGSFRVRTSDLKCWESEVNLPPVPSTSGAFRLLSLCLKRGLWHLASLFEQMLLLKCS